MARDTLFTQILERLSEIHEQFEDIRFGQCLQIALDLHKKRHNSDLNNYNSKVILKALDNFESETKYKREV